MSRHTNNDPTKPWNGANKDNPFAPHNGYDADNPFKPWNDPIGNTSKLTETEKDWYRRNGYYGKV